MQRKKEINGGDGSARTNLTFAFQKFSRSYALIQVFCFCSTNFTWFNRIIKYKNLSTNKYVWFNKTFSLHLTKLFIVKKWLPSYNHPYLLHNYCLHTIEYILKLKYFEGELGLFIAIAYLTRLSP